MILAVASIPESADVRVLAANMTGLVLADLNRKLIAAVVAGATSKSHGT